MGTPADPKIGCLLADQPFDGPLGTGYDGWAALSKWSLEGGLAKFDQGMGAGRPSIYQWFYGWEIGKRYTVTLDILDIVCDPGPYDGLVIEWGGSATEWLFDAGGYAWNFECSGPGADYFNIVPPNKTGGGASCIIDNCYLWLQTEAAFEFFKQNWLQPEGTKYEEYPVGSDFVTWYCRKKNSSRIAVKYSPP